ncbi:MAG: hypothetical protein K1X75_17575 [Leptospirales bacterium]|nr:hypothetical protein [Leptospirales bacterium]
MTAEQQKMREFVERLWSNPAIRSAPLSERETAILNFVKTNQAGLREAFARPEYFPGSSWEKAMTLLLSELSHALDVELRPRLAGAVDRAIHPAVREALKDHGGIGVDLGQLREYYESQLQDRRVRMQIAQSLDAMESPIFDRYGKAIEAHRRTIHFELTRRDRVGIEAGYLGEYFKLVALFRPLFFIKFDRPPLHDTAIADHARNQREIGKAQQAAMESFREAVGYAPDAVLLPAIGSFLPTADNPELSASARVVAILMARAQDLRKEPAAQDRGAETPDKSWFSIHRRIARNTGLDSRFLEDLYLIAGEEGW